ncbi:MAG: hypothetical protein GY737_01245 [Desulfobacteraceae bacterium]|nr:hypothetical protein [Desulfobacteraceae bacterium]
MKLLSWLDVKSYIRKRTDNFRTLPEGIDNIRFYSDEIVIEQREEKSEAITKAFQDWFPNPDIYRPEDNKIYLDIGKAALDISTENDISSDPVEFRERPRFDHLYFSKVFLSTLSKVPEPKHKFIAFHSFKGGVGRTLHLAAMIKSLNEVLKEKEMHKRILVIDGDLEAPGITFWEKNRPGGAADIGFTQFLETIQYSDPETGYTTDEVIQYFAQEILRFEHIEDNLRLAVLPAFSDPLELFQINVRPEHLSQDDNPWKLRECIDRLAEQINADYVFIDLRAGISELSAPFLLDPYIDRFLVTTLSEQSLFGTELILEEMTKINRTGPVPERNMLPDIIISMVHPDQDDTRLLTAETRFERRLFEDENTSGQGIVDEELLSEPISIQSTPFKSELLNIRSWEEVWDNAGSLIDFFKVYFHGLEEPEDEDEEIPKDEGEQHPPVLKLKELCSQYVFAEKTDSEDFLKTNFFKEFPRQYFNTLPLVVSLGTKGAGKTFHFMRMTGFMSYKTFCDRIEPDKTKIDADFFPILRSSEIGGDSTAILQLKENQPRFDHFDYDVFKTDLEIFRDEPHTESEWKRLWEKQIIQAISGNQPDITNFRQLNDSLKHKPVIFLFDGLENLFPDIHYDKNHQNAVSALLNIPGRLSEIRNRNIGLVIFLRQDYLGSAKRENKGQFEKKYEAYRLLWDKTAFLRLVFWLATKSGAIEQKTDADPSTMDRKKLSKELNKLWGLKLGKDNSKEAYTINWVYGALSDFKGYLQARDVVRFLEEAAKASETASTTQWKNRLLPPRAIRSAMNGCSLERVKELKQESKVFETWATALQTEDELVIPFSKTLLGNDSSSKLVELKKLGVVYEDVADSMEKFRFYIPEIYRIGLGFKFKRGARPKVLNIKRKAIGKGLLS